MAGGNGTGTMSPGKGMIKDSKNNSGILYFQGETKNDIYFKFGQVQGRDWVIEQIKVDKKTDMLNEVFLNALEQSKLTNNWSKIDIFENLEAK